MLALALLITSAASLLLVRHAASINAQKTVLNQAQAIKKHTGLITPAELSFIQSVAGIDSASTIVINPKGTVISKPPPNIPLQYIDGKALVKGQVIYGAHNHIAFAGVFLLNTGLDRGTPSTTVALIFESKEHFSVANVPYFALAGLLSLLVAAAFSIEISRRISRHVKAAARAAQQIATGDFSARMTLPGRGYPELVELRDSLNLMAADLGRSREAERGFLLSISHELRTPLTSIRGYAEAIAEGQLPSPSAAAQVVVQEADRLTRLIEDLLAMARLSVHQFTFIIASCDLIATAQSAVEALRYACEECNVILDVETDDVRLVGETDADRLSQIISNLVENAIKYAKTRVDVKIRRGPNSELLVSVGDDGTGIDPEDQAHVFKRLFTVDRTSDRKIGTGLGLAIVAELTEALGGIIMVVSPRDSVGGTIFELAIPQVAVDSPES